MDLQACAMNNIVVKKWSVSRHGWRCVIEESDHPDGCIRRRRRRSDRAWQGGEASTGSVRDLMAVGIEGFGLQGVVHEVAVDPSDRRRIRLVWSIPAARGRCAGRGGPGPTPLAAAERPKPGAREDRRPAGAPSSSTGCSRAAWKKAGVKPARPATDEEYLRRAYLDLLGRIPNVQEARAFLQTKEPDRREKLVDYLLEHADYPKNFGTQWTRPADRPGQPGADGRPRRPDELAAQAVRGQSPLERGRLRPGHGHRLEQGERGRQLHPGPPRVRRRAR